ncbi:MAG: hypothetical protein HY348_06760 [Nitrospira defluvii]|nr:hypothetical protein [Nitrospira defluvii]
MGDKNGRVGAGVRLVGVVCGMIVAAVLVVGCASEKPKPMAQPSSEQVKGNADRAFDKLKQEERERKPAGM